MRRALARDFILKWAEALNIDPMECSRIVIDAKAQDVLRVYVSKFGSEKLLNVEPPAATEVQVTIDGVDQ